MNPPVSLSRSRALLLLLLLLSNYFSEFQSHAQLIPQDEVQALQAIARKLNIGHWVVSEKACQDVSTSFNKITSTSDDMISNVTCNCSYSNNTICHVTNIQLKILNLTGVIPDEFASLTQLIEIDLTMNYINGSIPTSLTKIPLQILSIVANRLSGTIPTEIGQISTLQQLVLENNLLGGQLPPSLGNLRHLSRLVLSANNFTGTIPETFVNLTNLQDFRIDGNSLSGKIPSFIGSWASITKLNMQGTNMEGPIPSTINSLTNLTDLVISDLGGSSTTFPNLSALSKLTTLVLRNCLITGPIPDYIGNIEKLKTLDLSFNNLTGNIPNTFQNLNRKGNSLLYIFLTNNSLNGSVPSWMISSKKSIDLSYNNFTGQVTASCEQSSSVNLASSFSTNDNSNSWCWRKDLPCPQSATYHSLFINCGGPKITYGKNEYGDDTVGLAAALFTSVNNRALSSTGAFIGNTEASKYLASSTNVTGPAYYQTARLSPLSLKYYGICMRKGSYKVQLHFAEIMFTNDHNYTSNGRRIFDVAIQGNVVLKDFNIMEEAGGAGKGITKEFLNVSVEGGTLEIHLYWKGKGTNIIPTRGVYGPLISAITVTPNFKTGKGLSVGAIVGIVVASVAVLALILVALKLTGFLGRKEPSEFEGLGTGYFSLRQIKAATDNFNPANKIGEGGFGPVYKGTLPDGNVIAVKQLSAKSKQGNREFVNEIGMISALQHPNLVKLHGCCIEGKELLLIYEYMENNSLARAIFGREEQRLNLDWPTRKQICLGIARGLTYLHEESRLKIVHRDIKATNVLLDKDLTAKISDFGLAKLDEEEDTHISTRMAGTVGYMAPEYATRGYLTYKADVYSYGVVILEIVSGKSNTSYRPKDEFIYLLDWAYVLQEQGNLLELVDPSLGSDYSREEALRLLNLAILCTNPSPTLRPIMSSIVSMIEGTSPVQASAVKLTELELSAIKNMPRDTYSRPSATSQQSARLQGSSVSMDGPWIDSSVTINRRDETEGISSPSSPILLR